MGSVESSWDQKKLGLEAGSAVWPWASGLTSLSLIFPIHKVWLITHAIQSWDKVSKERFIRVAIFVIQNLGKGLFWELN